MKSELLIIFYRNPELGKVKTRLAATVGEARAFAIYLKLASHTRTIVSEADCDRVVYYSDYIDTEDAWSNTEYVKRLQVGNNLGDKMMNAFEWAFSKDYQRVCIIGTDCLEVTSAIVNEAYETLKRREAVIGPAVDGGYYLLGMNRFIPELFSNKKWSTNTVCRDTIQDLGRLQFTYELLPTLRDIDYESDLPHHLR
jgi:rSAM/selenodomain-associated transferase 1